MAASRDLWMSFGGQFDDSECPLHFGDPAAEYRALKEGAGLLDWSDRMHFLVTAATPQKALEFVNGQVSNDVKALQKGQGMRAAILNRFGKILADCDVLRLERGFLIVVEAANANKIDGHLGRAAFLSKCALTDFGLDFAHLRLLGPRARDAARALGLDLDHRAGTLQDWKGGSLVAATLPLQTLLGPILAVDLFASAAAVPAAVDALLSAGQARLAGTIAYEQWRIQAGLPRWGADFDDKNILPEVDNASWISYTKGCYVGQEIVAKVKSRGGPIRTLVALEFERPVTAPGSLLADGNEVGTLTSSALLPNGRAVGIGMLNRGAPASGLTCCGAAAQVRRANV